MLTKKLLAGIGLREVPKRELISDILIMLVKTLIEKGFELPIYIFMVSQNGNVVTARYEGSKTDVLLEHIVDKDWKLPINSFFVDGTGQSETITIPEGFTDTAVV